MPRKSILACFVLFVAVLACNLQTATPSAPDGMGTPSSPSATSNPGDGITPVQAIDTPVPTLPSMPTTLAPAGLTLDLLRNGTYHTPFYNRTITLVNGSFTEGSGSGVFSVQMLNLYGFGDLNGDGKDDAAILLAESGGGSGSFISLLAITNQAGLPHQESQVQLGDRIQINSVDISSGVIHLNMVVQGPIDPLCCPSQPQKQNYWLIGNKLWLMRQSTTIAGFEHIINIDSPAIWSTVTNPFTVSGNVTILPFENTLAYHIYLIDGTIVNESSLTTTPSVGNAGSFSRDFNLSSAGLTDWIIIQFADISAADGSTLALGSVILKAP
jgi:hypothetical protein